MSARGEFAAGAAPGAPDAALDAEALLGEQRERVDRALEQVVRPLLAEIEGPLGAAVAYSLETRGKRIRPILCVAAYQSVSGQTWAELPDTVYRLACSLEIVHTYSLVHDDLPCMDDDDLRRGRPTAHRVHGVTLATLAGAALLPLAVQVLTREARELGLRDGAAAVLVRELCTAAGAAGMVGGQLLDLRAEHRAVDGGHLERIHRAKTGALLTAALRMGAIAAGAGAARLEALTEYGAALGLAFQIADDILDVTGDPAALGKTAGRDQTLQKASYPALHGLDGARRLARSRSDDAVAAVSAVGGLETAVLRVLARYVVERSG